MPSSESSPVLSAECRSWNYWFVDGLPNLMAGILCILLSGALILVSRYRHTHNLLVLALVAVMFGVFIVLWLRLRQTLEWLKSQITYRRTGYVPPPYFTEADAARPAELVMLNLSGAREREATMPLLIKEDLRWRLWVSIAVLIAEPLAGRFISSHVLCVLVGCAGGVLALLVSRKDPRKSWAVVFGLLFAQVYTVNFLASGSMEGAFCFLAGVGFVLALAGAIVLTRYLRRHPVASA